MNELLSRLQIKRLASLGCVVVCALLGFWGMFGRVKALFCDDLEDMSFGWYVPLFSIYILWTQRAKLKEALAAPAWGGFFACIPCILVALLGTRGLQVRFEQVGFIGLCIAVPWAFFGRRFARLCVFPALFLCFTISLSMVLDTLTMHLRLLASGTAFTILHGCGVEAVQRGSIVYTGGGAIDVADACSGLRSLFALMALTAAYAWSTQPTFVRRTLLFLCAIPLAVLGNVTRILSICLVTNWFNPKFALGFYHDYSGYLVFIVAIGLMIVCDKLITRLATHFQSKKPAPPAPTPPAPCATSPVRDSLILVLTTLTLCTSFIFQSLTPVSTVTQPPAVKLPTHMKGNWKIEPMCYCLFDRCAKGYCVSEVPSWSRLVPPAPGATLFFCPHCAPCLACGERGRNTQHETIATFRCATCRAAKKPISPDLVKRLALKKISLSESTVLPADTHIERLSYVSPNGTTFLVSAVIGGETKNSIHRPEICLPSQGFTLAQTENFRVGTHPFHAVRLENSLSPIANTFLYTFVNQSGFRTHSHWERILKDVWDRSVLNRIDRWIMFTIYASSPSGMSLDKPFERQEIIDFLEALMQEMP